MEGKVIKLDVIYFKHNETLLNLNKKLNNDNYHLGKYEEMTIIGTEELNITNIIDNTRSALEAVNSIVLFLGIKSIDDKKNVFLKPFFKNGIKKIFDGTQTILFSKLLDSIGYKADTDRNNIVTRISLKS